VFIGGRVPLTLGAPWADVRCEVDSIDSWPVRTMVATRAAAFIAAVEADDVEAQLAAYPPLVEEFVGQARPAWNLVNPKGPIQPTDAGCYLVPVPLVLQLVEKWLDTFEAKPRRTRAKSG
jgi:hypothetical protein